MGRVYALNVVGTIPAELESLRYLANLNLQQNYLTGPVPSFIGKLTFMQYLGIGSNNFTGELPEELGNLTKLEQLYIDSSGFSGPFPSTLSKLKNLEKLWASDNDFTGKIPDYLGTLTKLVELRFQGNSFQGPIPASLSNLSNLTSLRIGDIVNGSSSLAFISNLTSLNILILRNCKISDNLRTYSTFRTKLFTTRHSMFARFSRINKSMKGSDNTIYEVDAANLGVASYYVTRNTRWGVSNVGIFNDASSRNYVINSSQQFQNTLDSELFQTARMSPSSLRYYGLGLENGNYSVKLQFAEFAYPDSKTWESTGRRIFDIYVQGVLKEKNFDIRKAVGGKSFTAVNKIYNTIVSKNFLEIHLFWAGKGTCCIPTQGYYGPMISALSVTPNFTPTVRNGEPKKKSKAGVIVGIVIGALVLGSAALVGIFMLISKRRKATQQQEELYNLAGRPNVFSNAELKLATENFSSQNMVGEGGYGQVYKGKLPDGRVIAVKQLSQSSHQGKSEFVTEVATISAVQHRNLVKLHGCCIDSNTPLLVYEYLENGSLDRALFGSKSFNLDWPTRFEIVLGVARGLTYLHEESSVRIVHRDIKASNVLLDTDLTPKISDFGLAKLYDEKKTHISTKIAGTLGYLAPEYAMRGHLTEKADVFAFGVVALETVAGRPNTDNSREEDKIYLFEWAWTLYESGQALGIVDPKLKEFNEKEALRVICAALLCTQGSPHQRPSMSRVMAILAGDIEVTEVVTKPSYITEWQLRGGGDTSYATSSYYSGSTTGEFREKRETAPLNSYPGIAGRIDEGR
uniref:non-specific serine/threonine protein kinase n=1 Tax=Oryza nivara TaxID=4536 RepID=A0A0E0I8A7_ORYNI